VGDIPTTVASDTRSPRIHGTLASTAGSDVIRSNDIASLLMMSRNDKPHTQPGDLFEDLAKIAITVGEQTVDLVSDTVGGRYSLR
jgi:hypothetical protein